MISTMVLMLILALDSSQEPSAVASAVDSKRLENLGIAEMHSKNWQKAKEHLQESYRADRTALRAYLLSKVFAELKNPLETYSYSKDALRIDPPLESKYREGALKLLKWAITAVEYEKRAEIDSSFSGGMMPIPNEAYRARQRFSSDKQEFMAAEELDEGVRLLESLNTRTDAEGKATPHNSFRLLPPLYILPEVIVELPEVQSQ